jgi:hypothetical protein
MNKIFLWCVRRLRCRTHHKNNFRMAFQPAQAGFFQFSALRNYNCEVQCGQRRAFNTCTGAFFVVAAGRVSSFCILLIADERLQR